MAKSINGMQVPIAYANRAKTGGKNLSITVSHRELVEARIVDATTIFYQVRATNKSLFRWLSTIAPSYEYFEVLQGKLEYIP